MLDMLDEGLAKTSVITPEFVHVFAFLVKSSQNRTPFNRLSPFQPNADADR
jgi:hypothetical protein